MSAPALKTNEEIEKALSKATKVIESHPKSGYYNPWAQQVLSNVLAMLMLDDPSKSPEELSEHIFNKLCIDQLEEGNKNFCLKYGENGSCRQKYHSFTYSPSKKPAPLRA